MQMSVTEGLSDFRDSAWGFYSRLTLICGVALLEAVVLLRLHLHVVG
jgi:hypothetical protein